VAEGRAEVRVFVEEVVVVSTLVVVEVEVIEVARVVVVEASDGLMVVVNVTGF